MREINYKLWSRRFLCFVCTKHWWVREAATIRVMSGIYGGGWPACLAHESLAIEEGLRPLSDPATSDAYLVVAYRVDVDPVDGGPKMGKRLWIATKRVQIPVRPSP